MDLLIIRHALAERREVFALTGEADSARPLVGKGRKRMKQVVRGVQKLVPQLDVLAASPYVRASQTAEIVVRAYGKVEVVGLDALIPGGERRAVLNWLQMQPDGKDVVALVGHEPDLGMLASWLLSAGDHHFVELKKGGACLLSWPNHVAAGTAWLRWLLTPSQLREIGKAAK